MPTRTTPPVPAAGTAMAPVGRRIGGRAGLVALAVAAGLGLLGSILFGAMATSFVDGPNLYATAMVVTERQPATTLEEGDVFFGTVELTAPAQYDVQWLEGVGVGLPYAVFGATCILLLVLVRCLWTGRSFTGLAVWGLGVVGLLTIASAALSRWLPQLAADMALGRLGLPRSFEEGVASGTGEWFGVEGAANGVVDYTGIWLGVVLLLLAVLVHRGRSLEDSVDGLV